MITLFYRRSQNNTGWKRYPGSRRCKPLHNTYRRFVCPTDQNKVFQAFSLRCEVPKVPRPGMQETQKIRATWLCDANFEGKDMQLVRFFLLEEQAEECFNWCDAWYNYLLLRVQRHRQSENKTVNLWPMVVGVRDAYTLKLFRNKSCFRAQSAPSAFPIRWLFSFSIKLFTFSLYFHSQPHLPSLSGEFLIFN